MAIQQGIYHVVTDPVGRGGPTDPCGVIDMTVAPERLVLRANTRDPLLMFHTYSETRHTFFLHRNRYNCEWEII